jgi:hypothetical protein
MTNLKQLILIELCRKFPGRIAPWMVDFGHRPPPLGGPQPGTLRLKFAFHGRIGMSRADRRNALAGTCVVISQVANTARSSLKSTRSQQ